MAGRRTFTDFTVEWPVAVSVSPFPVCPSVRLAKNRPQPGLDL